MDAGGGLSSERVSAGFPDALGPWGPPAALILAQQILMLVIMNFCIFFFANIVSQPYWS